MSKTKLPFTWQDLYDWYVSRHYQPAEAYTEADAFWKVVAPLILEHMTDAEVAHLAAALSAEHGTYNDGTMFLPDITAREFPTCLESRLKLIARRKAFAEAHQAPEYRMKDQHHMVALHVYRGRDEWHWEVIHGHLLDSHGTAGAESSAWKIAEDQWDIARPRLTMEKGARS